MQIKTTVRYHLTLVRMTIIKKTRNKRAGLRSSFQKTKIITSSPFTSWQIDGEKNGNSDRLYFLAVLRGLWDLVPQPMIESGIPAMRALSPNH